MFFALDGGRSWFYRKHPVGEPSLIFFALMMGAPRSPTLPPRGPTIDVLKLNGGCSQFYQQHP
jgi:hypothetical protein